ncbi:unnamed protein product, partial [marine sediment metagenome]
VEIDATSTTDTFQWSDDGGGSWNATGIEASTSATTLNNGVTVTFASTTGHDLADYWDFTVTVTNPLAIQNLAGTRSLFVGNDGKVGIGTTTPGAKLHVYDGAGAGSSPGTSDFITIENDISGFLNIISGTAGWGGVLFSDDTRAQGFIYHNHSTNKMHFAATGGDDWDGDMVIDTNGNVGIGTTTPASTLHVFGDLRVGTTTVPTLFVDGDTGNVGIGTTTPTGIFVVATSTGASLFHVDGSGNVGIGTASPGYPMTFAASTGGKIQLYQAGNDWLIGLEPNEMRFAMGNSDSHSISFRKDYASGPSVMVLKGSGNVGIGTETPSSRLTIVAGATDGAFAIGDFNAEVIDNMETGAGWVVTEVAGSGETVTSSETATHIKVG